MHVHKKIFEFAASAGAFEGYVYHKKLDDIDKLNSMVKGELPKSVDDFQKEKWYQE